ncbi:hypothetical protein KKF55_00160 [Patescibacteria group bacterium]|nr:hypothetical protein [Patescibacteria group bacterium]
MRKLWLIPSIIVAPIVLIIAYSLSAYVVLLIIGYHPDAIGKELAQKLVQNGDDVKECMQIIHPLPHLLSPSDGEQRSNCVYEYASLTKDPTACELLLPSDYGWSCLGTISGKLFAGRLCTRSGALDHIKVYCNRDSEGELTIDRPQIEDCSQYQREDLQEWCYGARTELLNGVHDCSHIKRDVVYDYCEYSYALKERNPQFCSSIKDKPRREFCEFRVDMMLKYP